MLSVRPPFTRRVARLVLRMAVVMAVLVASCFSVAWLRFLVSSESRMQSLPPSGPGFSTYSIVGAALGRQYVRDVVAASLLEGIRTASSAEPGRTFVIAETGWREMGPFRPHATHRSGLSVDIHVPLKDAAGKPTKLDSSAWNLWGYCWHLDELGRVAGLAWEAKPVSLPLLGATRPCPTIPMESGDSVDFEAIARLLRATAAAAEARGGSIRAVIVAPEYVDRILMTKTGKTLGKTESALTQQHVWIRHDDHIHIELSFPEKFLGVGPQVHTSK